MPTHEEFIISFSALKWKRREV